MTEEVGSLLPVRPARPTRPKRVTVAVEGIDRHEDHARDAARPRGEHDAVSPADVVESYIAAINEGIATGEFRRAWELGGKNLDSSYEHFVEGFSGTSYDEVLVRSTDGNRVGVRLLAHQTDGTIQVLRGFEGTYTVTDGVLVSADLAADGQIADPCFRMGPRC